MLIPFDILYEGFCNRIRSSGKSESLLQSMKKENNDQTRIRALLQDEPDLYSLLERNIGECYETKNGTVSKQLWKRGVEGKSLNLLTEAICLCPVPSAFEEKVLPAFDKVSSKALLKSFMDATMKENPEDLEIMANIFFDKACLLFARGRFYPAFKDFIRAWLLGFSKTLELTFQVAVCCGECGELENGKELLQCTAQYLRALTVSNEKKSEWTMNIVKALKVIESKRKNSPKNKPDQQISDVAKIASEKVNEEIERFSDLFAGQSDTINVTSKTVALKYSPEKGRHLVALEQIPPGNYQTMIYL